MTAITLDGVSVSYPSGTREGRIVALDDVSLHVRSGEMLALVGPSGCGKSTVLRTIAGLEEPDVGTVALGDEIVNALTPGERDVALVSQYDALLPHLDVEQNMAFALRLRKVPQDEAQRRVDAEVRTMGLRSKLRRRPRQLSMGDRQKVALGRATTRKPRAFLFDEPLAALDAGERVRMRRELQLLQRGLGVTSIYVTHDQRDAMALGDRVAVMTGGRIVQIGEPMQIYRDPADLFVARFFGTPPLGVATGPLYDDGSTAWIDVAGTALRLQSPQRAAVVAGGAPASLAIGLRAAAVHLDPVARQEWHRELSLTVRGVEPLGSTTVVALGPSTRDGRGARLYATVAPTRRITPGDALTVVVDLRNSFVFDGQTGARLHPRRMHTP